MAIVPEQVFIEKKTDFNYNTTLKGVPRDDIGIRGK